MSELLEAFRTRCYSYSRVPSDVVSEDATDRLIGDAVNRHSREKPQVLTASLSPSGNEYALNDVINGTWTDRHYIAELWYYTGGRRRKIKDWEEIFDGTSHKLLIEFGYSNDYVATYPSNVYVQYKAPHTIDDSVNTIHQDDLEAVGKLVASKMCGEAAQEAADNLDPMITADTVNYQTEYDTWRKSEKKLLKEYEDHINRTTLKSVMGDWDSRDEYDLKPLFHGGSNY